MTVGKTVRRNTKQFVAAIEGARNIRVFSLDNGFSGTPVDEFPRWIEPSDIQLVVSGEKYTARVHSNLWFEFGVAA